MTNNLVTLIFLNHATFVSIFCKVYSRLARSGCRKKNPIEHILKAGWCWHEISTLWSRYPAQAHHRQNMFKFNFLLLDKACSLRHLGARVWTHTAPDQSIYLLTLVVRCTFPKPLTVDLLTISPGESLLQRALWCVKFSCLPAADWSTDGCFYYARKPAGNGN